jgi:hypothetical protein
MVKEPVFCIATVCLLLLLISMLSDSFHFLNIVNIYDSQVWSLTPMKESATEVIWYAFASEDSEDGNEENGDEENGDEENGDEENGDEENGDDETPDDEEGGNGDVAGLASSQPNGTTGDLGASPTRPIGKTGDLNPSIVNHGSTSDLGSSQTGGGGDAGVFGGNTDSSSRTFTHNAEKIAQELAGKTPLEISQYPVSALSTNDLRLALGFLDSVNLAKVLLNISPQDLKTIQTRLSSDYSFVNILNRLSLSDRAEVEQRLMIVQ